MLEYDRILLSEVLYSSKTSDSHEYKVCHYWCFHKIDIAYQPLICNDYHDITQIFTNLNDTDIAGT